MKSGRVSAHDSDLILNWDPDHSLPLALQEAGFVRDLGHLLAFSKRV